MKKVTVYPAKQFRSVRLLLPIIPICFLIFTYCGGGGGGGDTTSGIPPSATTIGADSITTVTAILTGTVNPNGLATETWFEWGTNDTLQNPSKTITTTIGAGTSNQLVSALLSGLSPGTRYYYRVVANNKAGTTGGTIANCTTASPPSLPSVSTLGASVVTSSEAQLNGNVIPNGLDTSAWFEWGTDNSLSPFSTTPTHYVGNGNISTQFNYKIINLSPGDIYFYRIAANNSYGLSRGSIFSFIAGESPSVTTQASTDVGFDNATLNGLVIPNGFETTTWFEWGTDSSLFSYNKTDNQILTSITDSTSVNVTLSGLLSGSNYFYRIVAQNASGFQNGDIISFNTLIYPPPPPPTNINAIRAPNTATISWSTVNSATTYNLYWLNVPGVNKSNGNKISNVTSPFTHSNLENNSMYYYVVTSENEFGEGQESQEVNVNLDFNPPVIASVEKQYQQCTAEFKITFAEEDVDLSSINDNMYLLINDTQRVDGTFKVDTLALPPRLVIIWESDYEWDYVTNYKFVITTNIKDLAGNYLESEVINSYSSPPPPQPVCPGRLPDDCIDQLSLNDNLVGRAMLFWQNSIFYDAIAWQFGVCKPYTTNIYWSTNPDFTKDNANIIINASSPHTHDGLTSGIYYYLIVNTDGLNEGDGLSETRTVR